jgi:hypothetical protein
MKYKKLNKMADKREDKLSRAITYISNMQDYEEILPTNFSKEIEMHKDTGTSILDLFEAMQDSGRIAVSRNKENKITRIVKLPDLKNELEFRRELRDDIIKIKNQLDSIELSIKKLLKWKKMNNGN